MAITFKNIALEESATVTARVASVQIARGSTNEMQEILTLGDPESSLALARVTDVEPPSTSFGIVTRLASTGVRVINSSAGDLNVTVAGYVAPSTIVTVSTGSVRVHQSTAGDLNVTVAGYVAPSTTIAVSSLSGAVQARTFTSSGGSLEGSTTAPALGVLGLHTRECLPTRLSTRILCLIQTAGGSTVLVSSAANVRHRVSAFAVTSTVVGFSSVAFLSSGNERWGFLLGSGSSGITGANLAVSQPGSLFETAVNEALNFSASSTGLYSVAISYFTE